MQANLQKTVQAACEEEDLDLSSVQALPSTSSASSACLNHMMGLPLTNGTVHSGNRGGKSVPVQVPIQNQLSSCGNESLDRLLDRKKDAVAASSTARKATMKSMNNVILKSEKALQSALNALNTTHECIGIPQIPRDDQQEPSNKSSDAEDLERRYLMLYRMSSKLSRTSTQNDEDVKIVLEQVQSDPYFVEKAWTAKDFQTIGYMETLRTNWDLLSSVGAATSLKLARAGLGWG